MLAAWLLGGGVGLAQALIDENFDSVSIGSLPSGWTASTPSGTAAAVSNNLSYSSPNSLRFDKTTGSGGAYPEVTVPFSTASGRVIRVRCKVRTSTSNHDSLYIKLRNAAAQELGGLRFSTAATIQYQLPNGSWVNTGSNYSANVWYPFQIEFDLDSFTYRAWIKDALLVMGAAFRTNTATAASLLIQDRVVAGSGTSYVDDLRIEQITPTNLNEVTDQNFDSTALNALPTGWTKIQPTNTAVGVSDAASFSDPNSLRFVTMTPSSSTGAIAIFSFGTNFTRGTMVVSYRARTSSTNHDALYAKMRYGTGGAELGGIRFNPTGVFAYQLPDGTWQATTNVYASNVWYRIVLAFNLDSGIFSAWADSVPIVASALFRNGSTNIGHSFIFQDRVFLGVGTSYVDNFTVTRVAGPADIGVGVAVSTNYALAGEPITFTVYVTNHSANSAGFYSASLGLPANLTILSNPQNATISGTNVVWAMSLLPGGAVTSLVLVATPIYSGNTNAVNVAASVSAQHFSGDFFASNNASTSAAFSTVGIPLLGLWGLLALAAWIAHRFWRGNRARPAVVPNASP
jgi:hypothetical protein